MQEPLLRQVSFEVPAGTVVGVVGASASGKTSLLRVIAGILRPTAGVARIDSYDMQRCDHEGIGQYIGYVPQEVELFDATIAENIARMDLNYDMAAVISAATIAGIHDMIMTMPSGYKTIIGLSGVRLSGGQKQRVALARALYGNVKVLIMDEPNANLDRVGEQCLLDAVLRAKSNGTTVIFTTHKPQLLSCADKILMVGGGTARLLDRAEAQGMPMAIPPKTSPQEITSG